MIYTLSGLFTILIYLLTVSIKINTRFLSEQRHFQKPDNNLLLEDRREFVGEIKKWLKSIQREDIINAMICAFREDVKLRFEESIQTDVSTKTGSIKLISFLSNYLPISLFQINPRSSAVALI